MDFSQILAVQSLQRHTRMCHTPTLAEVDAFYDTHGQTPFANMIQRASAFAQRVSSLRTARRAQQSFACQTKGA